MPRKKTIKSEKDVKFKIIKPLLGMYRAFQFMPRPSATGVVGIHDHIACVPVTITEDMVGQTLGLFVSIEAKAPGRRGEEDRGMSNNQRVFMQNVEDAGGLALVFDGERDDIGTLVTQLRTRGASK